MRNNYNSLRLVVLLCVVLFSCQTGLAYSQADFNRNGIVDLDDFSVLAQNWLEVDASKAGFVVAASDASDESKTRADYICDGTADDVEIQAAIYSLPTVGGKVYLTEGTFNTTAKVLLPDNIWLQGSGFSTVINCGTLGDHIIDSNDVSGGYSQITITDLKFDGSSQTNDYSVIHLKNVDHSYISNVYIVGGVEGEHGIYFATVSSSRIDNVTIETVDNDSIRIEQGCSDIVVENVLSINPGEDHISIELQDASSNYNKRIVISDVVGHGGRHGFYVDHADNVSVSNTVLYNISDRGFDVGKTYASEISLSESLFDTNTRANTDLIFVHPGSSHINISNCILKNSKNHGISLEDIGSYDVTITGCKIINSDDCGIRTRGSYVTISNCTIDTTGNGTIPNGIFAGGDHLMISNCYFKDIGNFGIYATGDDISVSNCQMRNCYSLGIMCTGNRINISNCTIDTVMDGNSVEEESAITVVNANDVTISNCIIKDINGFGIDTNNASNLIVRGCLFKSIGDIIYKGDYGNEYVIFANNIIDDFNNVNTMNIRGYDIMVMGNSWRNPPVPLTRLIYVETGGGADYIWITNNDFSIIADPIDDSGPASHFTQTPNMVK